ncbi:hypothetical protein [Acidisphaera sp. L21]|uniref:hypothetical protein n=1 Tax=Acidisphaera sp. L21 TaxID=1641851 RepID=UPI00131D0605|nr:hypothetical protein [Acidisphaera sp. L21]
MAGTSAVVEAVTKRGGIPFSRASKLAKTGMQIGELPKSGKGGGEKGTVHWGCRPIAFYGLSAAVAEPTTAMDVLVPIFAGAEFVHRMREQHIPNELGVTVRREDHYKTREPDNALLQLSTGFDRGILTFVDCGDLSQIFQRLLVALADGSLTEKILRDSDLQIFFTLAGPDCPKVSVQFDLPNGDSVLDLYRPSIPADLLPDTDGLFERSCIRRTAQIGPDFLIILSDLLRDSLQRTGKSSLPPNGGLPPGRKKKGATPSDVTPSDSSSDDETTAAKRGPTTTQSSPNSCKSMLGACVCPGEASELGALAVSRPERTHHDDHP